MFKKIKQTIQLFKKLDIEKIAALNEKVDLQQVVDTFSRLDENQMKGIMKMLSS